MAHLPDDSLPSQFDVVIDGTGQQDAPSFLSFSGMLVQLEPQHDACSCRFGAKCPSSCLVSSWEVSAAH